MSKLYLRAFCSGVVLFALTISSWAETAKEIAQQVMPSVVLVEAEDANGKPLRFGSGFVVDKGMVATNYHVIRDAAQVTVKRVGQEMHLKIREVGATDASHDLALIIIEGLKAEPLVLGDSDAVDVGDPIYVAGNPQGLEGTFSTGIVSSFRTVNGIQMIQITAPISEGSSGGPVVNGKGQVIGVATGSLKQGQNLNFVIPSASLGKLMSQVQEDPLRHLNEKERTDFLNHLEEKADDGDADSMYWLAFVSDLGLGGQPKNPREAMNWYTRAAEAGKVAAIVRLGNLYRDGRGVPKDPAKALSYYEEAAKKGDKEGMYNIGDLYSSGQGVPKNLSIAYEWYEKAAYELYGRAMMRIGEMYASGEGVEMDLTEAYAWYVVAADHNAVGANKARDKLGSSIPANLKINADLKAVLKRKLMLEKMREYAERRGLLKSDDGKSEPNAVEEERLAKLPTGRVLGIAKSVDGRRIAWIEGVESKTRVVVDGERGEEYDVIGKGTLLFSPDSRRVTYVAEKDGKQFVVVDGEMEQKYDKIREGMLLFSPDSKRVAYVAVRDGKQVVVVDGEESTKYNAIWGSSLLFSPDSKRVGYVAVRDGKQFVVMDGEESTKYDVIKGRSITEISSLRFSPDSKRVVYTVGEVLYTVRKVAKSFLVVDGEVGPTYGGIYSPLFSPNGRRVAYVAAKDGKQFVVVDGEKGQEYDEIGTVLFSPDSRRFVYVARDGTKWFLVEDGHKQEEYEAILGAVIFSPDSQRLAYGAQGNSKVFVVVDGEKGQEYDGIGAVLFSPDSQHVAYAVTRGNKWIMIADGQEGVEYEEITTGPMLFSADSRSVAYIATKDGKQFVVVNGEEGDAYDAIVNGPSFIDGYLFYLAIKDGWFVRCKRP